MASKKRPSSKKKNTQTKKKIVQKKVTVSSPSIVVPEKETIKEVAKEVKPVKKEKVKKNKAPKKGYFDEVKAETKKVIWPSKKDMLKYSIAVIIFVLIFGLYFYGLDAFFAWISSLIKGL